MPLSTSNVVQSNADETSPDFPNPVPVTLPGPTSGGAVIIGINADELITTPDGFIRDIGIIDGVHDHAIFRKQTSTGETSWNVPVASPAMAAWWVKEVSGLDPAATVDATASTAWSTATTKSSGTSGATTSADTIVIASHASWNSADATITWSGHTNSFAETHDVSTANTGTTEVSIAAADRFPGTTATFETTATASASALLSGLLVAYKAPTPPATTIAEVPVGTAFVMAARVAGRVAGGDTDLDLFTTDTTVQGSITIDNALAVTGAMNFPLDEIGISVAAQPFAIGDVVQGGAGETFVVRDIWATSTGFNWSNTVDRRVVYSTAGFTKIGTATLS